MVHEDRGCHAGSLSPRQQFRTRNSLKRSLS
jgi:hypothetical protein